MRRLAAIVTLLVAIVVLGVAQLVLPAVAAQRIASRLGRYGSVRSVSVDAFPAIELLWHHADAIHIRLASYRSGSNTAVSLLGQLGGVGSLDVAADRLQLGLLSVHAVTLRKRGQTLRAAARVSEADLRAAVPFLDGVEPVASPTGTVTLRGAATVLGVTASATATVSAVDGALILTPNVPFGALGTLTLFSDPHVVVQTVAATPASGGFSVAAQGVLR